MFQSWRLKLREAEEALRHGRLEQSAKLLAENDLRQYLPGQRLSIKLATALAERARHTASDGDLSSAWKDLEAARSLDGETDIVARVRRDLIDRAILDVENCLRAEDPASALARLEQLQRQGVSGEPLATLLQVARRLQSAGNLSRHGKFADALLQLTAAEALRPDFEVIGRQHQACEKNAQEARELTEQLHRAMAAKEWSEALKLAECLLVMAPDCRLAQDARQQAWAKVGARGSKPLAATQPWTPSTDPAAADSAVIAADDTRRPGGASKSRFLLWVDAVGGYLACLNDEVVLGQSTADGQVHVPILGDLSRRHAKIRRQGEGYVMEPIGPVQVEGKTVTSPTLLADGDEIQLGSVVRLRFRKPHALSASARLDFVSRHRTQPSADGVLLMAESCVLGPKWHNHIVCRDWPDDVVIYRQDDGLYCRSMQALDIDGQFCDGRGPLNLNSRVTGAEFSLSLEEI
jgi:hypothetical protein